jgi:hypothetical protein
MRLCASDKLHTIFTLSSLPELLMQITPENAEQTWRSAPRRKRISMRAKHQLLTLSAVLLVICGVMAAQDQPVLLPISEDRPALEFVGQFTNSGTSAQQYGYLSNIRGLGLNQIFTGSPQNETTAMFTFFSQVTTVQVITNGSVRVIHRVGTTTIYFNPTPAGDFNNPSSFQQGTPILVSNYTQQSVTDLVSSTFNTAHLNDITATTPFWLSRVEYQLGQVGRSFRSHYLGHVNTPGLLPSGWFGGYAVGVDKKDN